jgi:carbonic anhydrase
MKSAVLSLLLASGSRVHSAGWTYAGQDDWGEAYSMCDSNDQSPIDIQTDDAINDDLVCTKNLEWNVNYNHTMFRLANNGHALVLQAVEPSNVADTEYGNLAGTFSDADGAEYFALEAPTNVIGRLPNYFSPDRTFTYEPSDFCLHSFHFHWGDSDEFGSEHTVDGEYFPLEVHFVHYLCDSISLGATLEQFQTGDMVEDAKDEGLDVHQLAVVGIFFDVVENATNPAFDAIFGAELEHLDQIQYPGKRDTDEIIADLDLTELIPADINTAGYHAYEGSLTTPPCTNIVRWHVMQSHGWIGMEQMDKFRQLLGDEYGEAMAPNFRLVQDKKKPVYACLEGNTGDEEAQKDDDECTFDIIVWVLFIVICLSQLVLGVACCMKHKKGQRHISSASETMVAKH